jgi:hypothetical protein
MRSLKLKGNYGESGDKRSEIVASVLSKATSLQDLELLRFYSYSPFGIQLPRVLNLSTDFRIGGAHIDAPLLTHLKLVQHTRYRAEPESLTDQILPALTHLDVEYINRRLRYLQAPALHTFTIRAAPRTLSRYPNNEVWFGPGTPNVLNPKVLHIVKFLLTQEALIKILSSMDGIEELYVQGLTAKKSLFVFLGQPIKPKGEPSISTASLDPHSTTDTNPTILFDPSDPHDVPTDLELELEVEQEAQEEAEHGSDADPDLEWPLPSLKKLSIDISGYKQMTDVNNVKNLRSAAKACLKARRLAGLEIESMRIKVEADREWIYIS